MFDVAAYWKTFQVLRANVDDLIACHEDFEAIYDQVALDAFQNPDMVSAIGGALNDRS